MKLQSFMLGLLVLILVNSCNSESNTDILRADWTGIDLTEIKYRNGDYVFIKDSIFYYSGIILDFDKDNGGIWIGICFTNYKDTIKPDLATVENFKLFGRQIPNGLINTTSIDCFDLAYLNENGLKNDTSKFGIIGKVEYNTSCVNVGSISPSDDLHGLINFYNIGFKQRQKKPDDCKDSRFKIDAVRERYFDFGMIRKQ